MILKPTPEMPEQAQ